MASSKDPSLAKVVVASAARGQNLSVLGIGVAASLGLVAAGVGGGVAVGLGLLGLSVAAYGALVGMDVINPAFASKVLALGPPPRESFEGRLGRPFEPDVSPEQVEAPELREIYVAVIENHDRLRQTIGRGGSLWQDSLGEAYLTSCGLVRDAGRIACKGNNLRHYLQAERPEAIDADVRRLEQDARNARDEKAAQSYLQAAAAKREQLETLHELEGLFDRIRAQLTVIETSLDGLRARIVKLNAADLDEAALVGRSFAEQIRELTSDINILESTVEETMQEIAA